MKDHAETRTRPSLTLPGIFLGLGLGGFVDGILLHQIVQWHNMLSSTERWPDTTLKGMEANMRADGLFHAATWVLVALGLWMLWNAMRGRIRLWTCALRLDAGGLGYFQPRRGHH